MTKTIIFDYDGTIHHTLGIYEPAFRETYQWLTEQKVTEEREIGSVEIAGWLGLNSKEMWNTFLPELDQSYKEQASRMVGDLMDKAGKVKMAPATITPEQAPIDCMMTFSPKALLRLAALETPTAMMAIGIAASNT